MTTTVMPSVTAIFARRMIQAAGAEVDARAMHRSVGLDPDGSLDVTQRVAADAYYDLLERLVAQMEHGEALPLKVGRLMHPNDYGALGLAWKSAPTVRDSLERVERYCRLWTDNMTYELRERPDGFDWLLHRDGERRLGMRLSNEATLTSTVSLVRQTASDRFRPIEVTIKHPAPSTTTEHYRYFGCPVHFGATEDRVAFSSEALGHPNHLGDGGLFAYLSDRLDEEIRALPEEDDIERLVRRAVSASLSDGVPKMGTISKRLGMSERTLQRRLSDQTLSYKTVVEKARQELAQNLLQQSQYSLSDVAFLTGFSEHSAFTRAFKRWVGQTPSAYRKGV